MHPRLLKRNTAAYAAYPRVASRVPPHQVFWFVAIDLDVYLELRMEIEIGKSVICWQAGQLTLRLAAITGPSALWRGAACRQP